MPDPNTIAFGGVATGSINANEAESLLKSVHATVLLLCYKIGTIMKMIKFICIYITMGRMRKPRNTVSSS